MDSLEAKVQYTKPIEFADWKGKLEALAVGYDLLDYLTGNASLLEAVEMPNLWAYALRKSKKCEFLEAI